MSLAHQPTRKITISLPADVLAYADAQAQRLRTSRSQYIGQRLAEIKASGEEALASEGYRFYAAETCAFAEASTDAVAEALDNER